MALHCIIIAGPHLSLMSDSPTRGLEKEDLSGGHDVHLNKHSLIFISQATSRKNNMFLLCHNP
jgi:hypothetical protein